MKPSSKATTKMSNTDYNRAVRWIAYNDNDAELDQSEIEDYVTVALVADLFGKTTGQVGKDVFNVRKAEVA
jgi:hypothetical protein